METKENKIASSFGGQKYLLGESGIWIEKWRWGYHREEYKEGEELILPEGKREGEEYSRKKA